MNLNLKLKIDEIFVCENEILLDEGSLGKNVGAVILSLLPTLMTATANDMSERIKKNEGYKNISYMDTLKKKTIGIGFNIDANVEYFKEFCKKNRLDYDKIYKGEQSLNDTHIMELFKYSIGQAKKDAKKFIPNLEEHPDEVQSVVVEMAFQLGLTKLLKFEDTQKFLIAKDYVNAAKEMLDSKWAKSDTPARAKRLAEIVRTATDKTT